MSLFRISNLVFRIYGLSTKPIRPALTWPKGPGLLNWIECQALSPAHPIACMTRSWIEQIFRHNVLKMLLAKGKITRDMISLLDKWRHSGFNVFFGPRILPRQEDSMENLARYIVRASFSRERMTYHRVAGRVEYQSKDGRETRVFDALEWPRKMRGMRTLARHACLCVPHADRCSHVPNMGEQMARYYGYYSNVARGKRKEADADLSAKDLAQAGDKIPCIHDLISASIL